METETEAEAEGPRPKGWFSELRAWSAKEPLQAVTAAGVLTYVSFRIAFLFFYNRFGVTPEEVGHSYSSTLAQAVGAIAIYAAFMLGPAMFLANLIVVGVQMFRRDPNAAWLVAFGSVIGAAVITSWVRQASPSSTIQLVAVFVTSSGAFFITASMSHEGMEQSTRRASSQARSALPRVMLAGGLIVLLIVIPVLARIDARAVYSGRTRRSQIAGVLGLPWAANVARVEWLEESEATAMGSVDCFMYLGRSDGIAV